MSGVTLDQWVQPKLLTHDSIADLAERFRQNGECLWIDDFLQDDRLTRLAKLLFGDVPFQEEYGVYKASASIDSSQNEGDPDVIASRPTEVANKSSYQTTENSDKYMKWLRYVPLPDIVRTQPQLLFEIAFRSLFVTPEFLSWAGAISGQTDLSRAEIVCRRQDTISDHRLNWHNDYLNARKLCCVFYVSPDWQEEFGGRLMFASQQSEGQNFDIDPNRVIAPIQNRLVLFRPTREALHAVEPMNASGKDWQRISYTIWLLGPSSDR